MHPRAETDTYLSTNVVKDAKSARERYRVTKIKFGWAEKGSDGTPAKTPGSGRGKKPAQAATKGGDELLSPTAKVTKRRAPGQKTKNQTTAATQDEEDDSEDNTHAKTDVEALNAAIKAEEQDAKDLAGDI
jgi:hypothetical protein